MDHSIEGSAEIEHRMKELKLHDDSTVCQDIYSTLATCLPSWLSLQNLWSNPAGDADAAIGAYCKLLFFSFIY
jgi:hypothetical protein